MSTQKGYTLVEIFITIVIIAILATITYVGFQHYQRGVEIRMGAQEVKKALAEAQSRTIASKGASRWGVHFDNEQYILYKVDLTADPDEGYDSSSADNEAHSLSKNLEFCEINLEKIGGISVSGVYYQYLKGVNDKISGIVKVCNKEDNSMSETITIERVGAIEVGEAVSSTDNSRHLHFEISKNITQTGILRLDFTSDGVTRDVSFQDYYYEDEFSWSDIITVNDEEQRLKIHTHSLDSSSATLCIHRDERFNTRPLTISLRDLNGDGDASDSVIIVSYDADSVATKGDDSDIEMYVQ